MFSLSKLAGAFIEPAILMVGLAALVWLLSKLKWMQRLRTILAVLLTVLGLLLTFLPVGTWALTPLENRFSQTALPAKATGILLLTGDERPGVTERRGFPVGGWAAQRYIHLARLADRYPQAKLVIVGSTNHVSPSTKVHTDDIAANLLKAIHVSPQRVLYEKESRTTHENAVLTKAFVKPKAGETWIVISSAVHLPRAVLCFEREGWRVTPSPADYFTDGRYKVTPGLYLQQNLDFLSTAAHEYYGLVLYRMLGWIDRLWP
ncbi:MAG: YdcF family protein [Bdellovibrionales bacterium]